MVYINDNLQGLNLDVALEAVSEQRRQQALRFRHEQGRRECVAAYMLLKEGLEAEYSIAGNPEFEYDAGGKPRLKEYPHLHFNLSHCREAAICALDTVPVGIDIESIRPFKDTLARHVLSPEEYMIVTQSQCPDVEFIKYWTQKEALLKLTGEGIRRDLKTVLCDCAADVEFHTVATPRYIYSICRARC